MAETNIQQIIAEAMNDEYTELVVGFAIIGGKLGDGRRTVRSEVLTTSYENAFDFITLDIDEEVIGILPAPMGSLSVYKCDSKGNQDHLGYKYPGVYFNGE